MAAPKVSYKTKKLTAKICRVMYYAVRYAFSIFTTWLQYDHWSGY